MQRTAHYGLPIFEATDKPSILVDFNQAMQDIDESMFLIAAGGDSHVTDAIAALEAGLSSVTSQIATINQTLGLKLDTSFMHNLAAEFDRTMTYFKYDFVFADGNLYQCIEDYDPQSSSFDICFRPVWLCNSVAKAEADLEELSDNYDALESRVTHLENNPYQLQPATASTLGGVKVGNTMSVSASGVLDYNLPIASASDLGGIKVGSGLSVDNSGVLSANPAALSPATASTLGGVKIGSGVDVASDGTISVNIPAPYTLPEATGSVLGGVKIGNNLGITSDGVLTANKQILNYTFQAHSTDTSSSDVYLKGEVNGAEKFYNSTVYVTILHLGEGIMVPKIKFRYTNGQVLKPYFRAVLNISSMPGLIPPVTDFTGILNMTNFDNGRVEKHLSFNYSYSSSTKKITITAKYLSDEAEKAVIYTTDTNFCGLCC